jgi:hypothetical protein
MKRVAATANVQVGWLEKKIGDVTSFGGFQRNTKPRNAYAHNYSVKLMNQQDIPEP